MSCLHSHIFDLQGGKLFHIFANQFYYDKKYHLRIFIKDQSNIDFININDTLNISF